MTKKLDMIFMTNLGKAVTITLADPKDDLTKAEVTTVMNQIIAKSIFLNKSGTLASIKEMNIRTTDEVALV